MFNPNQKEQAEELNKLSGDFKKTMNSSMAFVESVLKNVAGAEGIISMMPQIKAEAKKAIDSGDTSGLDRLEKELKKYNNGH